MTLFKCIKASHKIRRKSWADRDYIEIIDREDWLIHLSKLDLLSTDWEVYKGE